MLVSSKNKKDLILIFGHNEKNTGSTSVQVAFLTKRIECLRQHFIQHKKDYHSRRGLLKMVAHRRKLLDFLKKKDINKYFSLIKDLEIRY